MSDFLYDALALIGYAHPIHPVLVHAPVGMSIGAAGLSLLSYALGNPVYRRTAYHMIVVAGVFAVFAIPVGIVDWRRFYGGAWLFEIQVKSALAILYLATVIAAVLVGRHRPDSPAMPVLYVSSVLAVMGLGFFGGQLVYQGFAPEAPEQYQIGRHVFASHCSGCHRRGENIIQPHLPLRNAPQLHDFNDFLGYIRDPMMPDGSPGIMPKFNQDKLTDQDAKQLYDYLYFTFLTPNRLDR